MRTTMLRMLLVGSVPIIALLVGAAFVLPSGLPALPRQILLSVIGIAGIAVAERRLFGSGSRRIVAALGFVAPRPRAVVAAMAVSLPMWLYLPIHAQLAEAPWSLSREWLPILLGVILLNGVAEEVIHRAFIFGHLRETRSFRAAATISAIIFAAQHVYLLATTGTVAGMASVVLAFAVAFPLAFLYEAGGNSLSAPAILHTSSNAPMMLFVIPQTAGEVTLSYMAVVLASMWLSFAFWPWLRTEAMQRSRTWTVNPEARIE
jgi:membrane protease YdiL (CAAX protease family)